MNKSAGQTFVMHVVQVQLEWDLMQGQGLGDALPFPVMCVLSERG